MNIEPSPIAAVLSGPLSQVAEIVNEAGLGSVVIVFNGTQRWFLAQRSTLGSGSSYVAEYMNAWAEQRVRTLDTLFSLGVTSIIEPGLCSFLEDDGFRNKYPEYARQTYLCRVSQESCARYGVRIRFGAEWRQIAETYSLPELIEVFEQVEAVSYQASKGGERSIFVFPHIAGTTDPERRACTLVSELTLTRGAPPSREDMISAYYGFQPSDVSIAFLLAEEKRPLSYLPPFISGNVCLYRTVVSPLALTEDQIRRALADYLYSERGAARDYSLPKDPDTRQFLQSFYERNLGRTLDAGVIESSHGIWIPEGAA